MPQSFSGHTLANNKKFKNFIQYAACSSLHKQHMVLFGKINLMKMWGILLSRANGDCKIQRSKGFVELG